MKPVQGFLADDGTFFEYVYLANKHDAEMQIRAYCSIQNVDADKLINYIEALADPIMRFVNASQEEIVFNKPFLKDREIVEKTEAIINQTDDERREDLSTTLFEQSSH